MFYAYSHLSIIPISEIKKKLEDEFLENSN